MQKVVVDYKKPKCEFFLKHDEALRSDSAFLWQPMPFFSKMILNLKSLVLFKMITFISVVTEKFAQVLLEIVVGLPKKAVFLVYRKTPNVFHVVLITVYTHV